MGRSMWHINIILKMFWCPWLEFHWIKSLIIHVNKTTKNVIRSGGPEQFWSWQKAYSNGRYILHQHQWSTANMTPETSFWRARRSVIQRWEEVRGVLKQGAFKARGEAIFQCIFHETTSIQLQPKPLHYWPQKIKVWRKRGCWKQGEMMEPQKRNWTY